MRGLPERAYERRWALAVIDRARYRLKDEFDRADKGRHFKLLAGHLTGSGDARPYREIAEELETTEAARVFSVKTRIRPYRRRKA